MSFPIHLTEEALHEELEAYVFYEEQQIGLGDQFLDEVEATFKKISVNPSFYSFSDETKTIRDVRILRFPFVIIYEIKAERIEVYHIHHTKKELK